MPCDKHNRDIQVGDHVKFETLTDPDGGIHLTIGRATYLLPTHIGLVHLVPDYVPIRHEAIEAKLVEVVLRANGDNVDG